MDEQSLEQRLLTIYKDAVGQHRIDIAEHVWSALEACAQDGVRGTVLQIDEYRSILFRPSPSVSGVVKEGD